MIPPRVFISYSHDSAEHKGWVLDFATTLRNRGIDAVLDQWDLKPGDDLPHFMETELAKCDFVVIVCTEEYVVKANAGKGGVGYEKMIASASLLSKIDENKIIPIVRQSDTPVLPTFLQSKLYINFSNDSDVEYSLDELVRTLLKAPLYEKPEIGANPFKPLGGSKPDRTADGLKAAMSAIAAAFEKSPYDELDVGTIAKFTNAHRLKIERYLSLAESEGLVECNILNKYSVTDDGYEYLINHGIIEA
ncbi:toll/interleukin-1 receptor domain-containing protein [Thiomicrorhabdus arctica]|uniref:toll/interleukin-1 receptor domain-containing protein n=1 Tax=Thiomicrorhabdus arctica TaxID=131540 RepID=UPI00036FA17A|nr:toll/interleukin-1 receptor domain-containing protein [Thiomicrorhabdus arctica]